MSKLKRFEENLTDEIKAFLRLRKKTSPPTKVFKDKSKYTSKKHKE